MSDFREMRKSVSLDRDWSKISMWSRCLRTPGSHQQKWAEGMKKWTPTHSLHWLASYVRNTKKNHFKTSLEKQGENKITLPRLPSSCYLTTNSDLSHAALSLVLLSSLLSLKSFFWLPTDLNKSQPLIKPFLVKCKEVMMTSSSTGMSAWSVLSP